MKNHHGKSMMVFHFLCFISVGGRSPTEINLREDAQKSYLPPSIFKASMIELTRKIFTEMSGR